MSPCNKPHESHSVTAAACRYALYGEEQLNNTTIIHPRPPPYSNLPHLVGVQRHENRVERRCSHRPQERRHPHRHRLAAVATRIRGSSPLSVEPHHGQLVAQGISEAAEGGRHQGRYQTSVEASRAARSPERLARVGERCAMTLLVRDDGMEPHHGRHAEDRRSTAGQAYVKTVTEGLPRRDGALRLRWSRCRNIGRIASCRHDRRRRRRCCCCCCCRHCSRLVLVLVPIRGCERHATFDSPN